MSRDAALTAFEVYPTAKRALDEWETHPEELVERYLLRDVDSEGMRQTFKFLVWHQWEEHFPNHPDARRQILTAAQGVFCNWLHQDPSRAVFFMDSITQNDVYHSSGWNWTQMQASLPVAKLSKFGHWPHPYEDLCGRPHAPIEVSVDVTLIAHSSCGTRSASRLSQPARTTNQCGQPPCWASSRMCGRASI